MIHDDSQGVIDHTSRSRINRDDIVIEARNKTIIQKGILNPRIPSVNNVVPPALSDLSNTSINVVKKFLSSKHIRSCIADQFIRVHQFPPVEQWGKVSRKIKETLKLTKIHNKMIRGVFKHVKWCISHNVRITFTRQKRLLKQKNVIDVNSPDAQLIADMLEHGYSVERACDELNRLHLDDNTPLVTLSMVYGCINRLAPLITPVKKGNKAPSTPQIRGP